MNPYFKIETSRLSLLSCTPAIYTALLQSEKTLSDLLTIEVPLNWSDFGLEPYAWALGQLEKDSEHKDWLTYLLIHREDQKMIGTCGYKGKPDASRMVEIGYGIIPDYRLQGLATEAARALIDHAFSQRIQIVQAHTLAEENASVHILRKCGLTYIQTLHDPDDGDIWQWSIKKS